MMSNSNLINLTRISPNRNSPRNQPIRKLTIHHFAGNLSIETVANLFQSSGRQASYNYGIGSDGRIVLLVPEADRSWASSSRDNDHQAITIGVANNTGHPSWGVSEAAMNSLIELCVDVCERNNIEEIFYDGTANGTLTRHDNFASTNCPGPFLSARLPEIATTINRRLKGGSESMIWSTAENRGHPNVLIFQKFLVEYLKPKTVIEGGLQGIIGPSTVRAINIFKKENKLPENGIIDSATVAAMVEHSLKWVNQKTNCDCDKLKADISKLTVDLNLTRNLLGEREQELRVEKSKYDQLISVFRSKETENTNLNTKIKTLETKIKTFETEKALIEKQINTLEKEKENVKIALLDKVGQLKIKEKEITVLQKKVKEIEEENKNLLIEKEELKQDKNNYKNENYFFLAEIKKLKEKVEKYEEEIERLEPKGKPVGISDMTAGQLILLGLKKLFSVK